MKQGNWVPMDKALVKALPTTRRYSLVEAVFSYQVDLDQRSVKAEREYARIWGWSRSKVRAFLHTNRVTESDATRRPIQFRFIEQLHKNENHQPDQTTYHQPDQAGTTTINPNPDPESLNPNANKAIYGVRLLKQPHIATFSFEEFKMKYDVDQEKARAIEYYLHIYKRYQRKEHPRLKLEQWRSVIDQIFQVPDEYDEVSDIGFDDFKKITNAHFRCNYKQGCDHNILHFLTGLIRIMRMRDLRMI